MARTTKVILLDGGQTYRKLYFRKPRVLRVEVLRQANNALSGTGKITVTESSGGTSNEIVIRGSGQRLKVRLEPKNTRLSAEQRIDVTNQTTMGLIFKISETDQSVT